MSGIKLGFSLKSAKKEQPAQPKPRNALFNHDDDYEEEKAREQAEREAMDKNKPKLKSKFGNPSAKRTAIQSAPAEEELDPSIYDYDAAYDVIHARDAQRKAEQEKAAEERKSRYIEGLMQSAEMRKQSLLRAKEKMLQREREAEGDEFADKEKFVTEAYRKQQEENRKLEEAEKKREEEEEERRRKTGATGFYKDVLEKREKMYQEAAEASKKAQLEGISGVQQEREKTERELAEEARAKGRDVVLNDEGEITDKRDLLSAGLNIVATPKQDAKHVAAAKAASEQSRYNGPTAGQQAMRERQSRMIESQLLEAAKRAADDEMEEQAKLEHASKSRKSDKDISNAKERYLQRKREAEAAKAAGTETRS